MTTNNTDGAALLLVTQADRDAAATWFTEHAGKTLEAECMRDGTADHWPLVQAFARHRDNEARRCAEIMQRITQSHSLPGEERLADWRDTIIHPNNRLLFRRLAEVAGIDIGTDDIATALRKVAALTPSPCPGDVDERLEHARTALQRIRDRFTNIGNSSPLWCDMAEDMDAYAAEGLDRSKARS